MPGQFTQRCDDVVRRVKGFRRVNAHHRPDGLILVRQRDGAPAALDRSANVIMRLTPAASARRITASRSPAKSG